MDLTARRTPTSTRCLADPLEPTDAGLMFREDNPVYVKAWQTMFGYKYNDMAPEHVKELLAAKAEVKQREGDNYPNWVLAELGIETELANRIALGRGHQPPHSSGFHSTTSCCSR